MKILLSIFVIIVLTSCNSFMEIISKEEKKQQQNNDCTEKNIVIYNYILV